MHLAPGSGVGEKLGTAEPTTECAVELPVRGMTAAAAALQGMLGACAPASTHPLLRPDLTLSEGLPHLHQVT